MSHSTHPHPRYVNQLPKTNNPGKRNTSRPVFTAHERALAKNAWSASSARLNRDSFLPFGSCSLCLESAVDPIACAQGHIFCRECALSNILAQKKEIKRLEKTREAEAREAAELAARQDEEAKARAVREFELVQAGFDVGDGARRVVEDDVKGLGDDGAKRGEKRKFVVDEEEVARAAELERAKQRKAIEEEKVSVESTMSTGCTHQLTEPIELQGYPPIFLGTFGDTHLELEGQAPRGEEEGQDITHMPLLTGKQPTHLRAPQLSHDSLHRRELQGQQNQDADLPFLQKGAYKLVQSDAG